MLAKFESRKTVVMGMIVNFIIISSVYCQLTDNGTKILENNSIQHLKAMAAVCPEFSIVETVGFAGELKNPIPNEKQIALAGHYNGIRPTHYDLNINFADSGLFKFISSVIIKFEVLETTNRLVIDMNPNSLSFIDKTKIRIVESATQKVVCLKSVAMVTEDRIMVAELSDNLIVGNRYTLDMGAFQGTPLKGNKGSWGLQLGGNKDTVWALTSIFQMRGARTVFPCFDHPSLKATVKVCIEHSADTLADSSAKLAESHTLDSGRILDCFEPTLKIPVYALALSLMKDFSKITDKSALPQLDLYYSSKINVSKFEWEIPLTRAIIKHMEEKTNLKYPLTKFGLLNVIKAPFWGVENFGLVTLEAGFTQSAEYERGRTIVIHEIIHQWLGNTVTCSDWTQICLQEGLTALLEWTISYEFNQTKSPPFLLARQARDSALYGGEQTVSLIHDFNVTKEIADFCFVKPPAILHMISYFFGDNVWYDVLRQLLSSRQYANANLSDWIAALDHVTGTRHAGEMLDSWYTSVGYPILYSYSTPQKYLTIKQYIDLLNDDKPTLARDVIITPIRVLTENGLAFPVTKAVIVKQPEATYNVTTNQWFILDPAGVTLSRKVYTVENYLNIIKCFVEQQSPHCKLETILDVFQDLCYMLTNNFLPWSSEIDDPLSGEENFAVEIWNNLFQALYNISKPVAKSLKKEFLKIPGVCRLCITEFNDIGKDKGDSLDGYFTVSEMWNENCKQLKLLSLMGRNYTVTEAINS